ncbi:MAG TPA: adenylate kinase [Vicinamibacterales bacterium]|jgi:adenylate kinase|nr:adenylate kinase [Vicinamibacterales bacterium]
MTLSHAAALNVVMLGPPGAGKGTQAERFARRHGVPKISTGDILREAVAAATDLGRAARETMNAGNLVGDDVMIGIIEERLARKDAARGFVLDGFPRTVVQASALDRLMNGRGALVVVDIVVPEDVLVRRLAARRICSVCGANAPVEWTTVCGKCGGQLVQRIDDGGGIVRERLKVYQRQTKPLVDYYSGRPTFRAVDGNRPPDVVTAALDAAICQASEGSTRGAGA